MNFPRRYRDPASCLSMRCARPGNGNANLAVGDDKGRFARGLCARGEKIP
jgi:hypothetical protein